MILLASFSYRHKVMVFHRSQVFRTILSIQVNLNNAVVWMVLICPLISKSNRLLTKLLRTIQSALFTIGITVTLMFHIFFVLGQDPSTYLSFRFLWFSLYGPPGSFFFLTLTRFGLLAWIRWSVCISKSQRILCILSSKTDFRWCILFTPLEFFPSALANGLSLEFEWQQVFLSLQDSSQYSGRSQ